VAYRNAYGDVAPTSKAIHASRRPPIRFPINQNAGSVATEQTPARARTATSPVPKASIQKCNST